MAQVLTNENMVEFIQTRQAPEFKAPEKPADAAASEPSKEGAVADASKDTPRDLTTGKFVKADGEKAPKEEQQAAPAADDDDHDEDGAKLSDAVKRKIDKIVAKKHRAMKEAEEFGREEYSARRAAEQRAEQLQREIEELKKSGSGPASSKGESDSDEPKPEDFKTVGEYTRALTKYEVTRAAKQAGEASKKQTEQERQQAQADERASTFAKRQSDYIKANPDYEEVVGDADFEVPNVAMQYMVESEYGPQLAHYLAKNPKDADRLRNLSPGRVLAELGKLEAKFEKQVDATPNVVAGSKALASVSRAPAPIVPLEGKSTTVTKDPKDMTFQELRAHRMAERAAGKR